jgi:hypothetical protein
MRATVALRANVLIPFARSRRRSPALDFRFFVQGMARPQGHPDSCDATTASRELRMNTTPRLLAGLGIALALSSGLAAAAASARGHDEPAAAAASSVVQAISASAGNEEADSPETPFFTSAKTCLLLGTIGALALIVRRRGVD